MIARHPGECRPHPYQDSTYGKGVRLMTELAVEKNKEPAYRCTVCAPPKEAGKKRGGIFYLSQLTVVRR